MKKIKGIKMELNYCSQLLEEITERLGIDNSGLDDARDSSPYKFQFASGGIINIYTTGNGLTLSANYGKEQDLGAKIINEFNEMLDNEDQIVKPSYAKYKISKDEEIFIGKLKNAIKEIDGIISSKNSVQSQHFQWDVKKNREKLSMTFYKNGTLLLQGKTHLLWDNVCDWIEKEIDSPVSEILIRMTSDENINEKLESKSGDEVIREADEELKRRLGDSYSFLDNHDKKFLLASLSLLRYNCKLPEYSSVVMPSFKALEGYLKKALINHKSDLSAEINQPKFNFGIIYEYNDFLGTHEIKEDICRDRNKTREFNNIYQKLQSDRNPYMHSTGSVTRTCDSLAEAESLINEVIAMIAGTYTILK